MTSTSRLRALTQQRFDIVVVGGGITGAGVARDAAMRGLRTALVERDDFACGTSSRSSRLVHGGVRYLEHGQLGMVFESSAERRTLLRIAPHLVRPLSFMWPVYEGARVSRWKLAAGLTLYDALSLFRNVGRHERLNAADALAREPALLAARLTGGASYWDASTDDVRLTLATILSAVDAGAVVANHAGVVGLTHVGGRIAGLTARDELSGEVVPVSARVVVNATGPWSDSVERLADPGASSGVRGSKGVHLCLPRERVGNTGALTVLSPRDDRVMFILPAGDFTIVGTTDDYETVSPDEVRANESDVAYLLEAVNHFFPAARLERGDVVSAWAGLRPLAAAPDSAPGVNDAGSASREHDVTESVPGLIRVTGGKLTTYRLMAAQAVRAAERSMGRSPLPSVTARAPLHGGDVADLARESAAAERAMGDARVGARLVHAHGSGWRDVWRLVRADPSLGARVDPARPYVMAELRHAVEREMAFTLSDLLVRRIPLAFELRDNGRAAAGRVAPIVASWLGWDDATTRRRVDEFDADVRRIFGVEP